MSLQASRSLLGDARFMEGVTLHKAGLFEDAGRIYQELLEANPNDPDLWHFKGLLALHTGKFDDAIRCVSLAITLKPAMPDYYRTIAMAYEASGQIVKAAEMYNKLGNALQEQCRFAEALEPYAYSLKLNPGFVGTMINRGSALTRLGRYDEGAADFDAALAAIGQPHDLASFMNTANALSGLGRVEEAIDTYTKLLEMEPENATAHCSRALLRLRLGQMETAWAEYEWRWSRAGGFREPRGQFRQKVWQGESPGELGGALLVIAEQGLGDVIQFARYIPLLADQGYDIIFETLPGLTSLFAEGFDHPNIRVVGRIDNPVEIENNLPFAAWVGVMSLPARFKTTLETIPANVPYISVAAEKIERWRVKLNSPLPAGEVARSAGEGTRDMRVGLVWAGNPKNLNDFARSVPPAMLEPILSTPQVRFYSLQKGTLEDYEFRNDTVVKLAPDLTDLTEAAAAIMALDLVITVDTSICHLAGALGRPVWLMIPVQPDWRWLNEGDTSPWYPTMRVFRQTIRGRWEDVIEAVADALEETVKQV